MNAIRKSAMSLMVLGLLTLSTGTHAQAAQGTVIAYDQHPRMRDFAELEYPPLARQEMVDGVVVVRIQLDDQGAVVSSTALWGSRYLVPDCLANIKKWHFEPGPVKTGVIIYDFQITYAELCAGPCHSQFAIRPPNFATITAVYHPLDTPKMEPLPYEPGLLSVPDFIDLEFPPQLRRAKMQDIVVVGIELDSDGKVSSSSPISGSEDLMPLCLENAKKWRFQPTTLKTAVIVYDFRIIFDRLCADPCHSQFLVDAPNFATITVGQKRSDIVIQ
jgi:TonB family protein